MSAISPAGDPTLQMKGFLAAAVAGQPEHPVYPRIVVELDDADFSRVKVSVNGQTLSMPAHDALGMIEGRQRAIALEEADPFRYGYEPPFWSVVDWAVAELRCRPGNERAVLEVLIQGGNRAAKTEYAGKRFVGALVLNENWLCWGFHADQSASRSVQQRRVWRYLPPEYKPDSGKLKKTVRTKMNYSQESGFTENIFSLPNGSAAHFKFYSADVKGLEGDEPDFCWSDEEIPEEWVDALAIRLNTKAGKTAEIVDELRVALEARDRGELQEMPANLRAKMWRGVHLITFTPISGLTPTVRRFTHKARPTLTVPAELLPLRDAQGKVCGYEHVPRLIQCAQPTRMGAYFHTYDNRHGGNYDGMKAAMRGKPVSQVKIRVYGVTEATRDARFPLFSRQVHVRPATAIPKDATWYHVVDPCNGRNWFMIWACVNPLGEVLVAREWPQPGDYVEGVGVMGPWAVLSAGKKADGDRGPAQVTLGWGIRRYVAEIERIERELGRAVGLPAEPSGDAPRIQVAERIIDSRAGNTPTLASSETVTLMELLADQGLYFEPAGMMVAAEGQPRRNTINEGIDLLNDALSYDPATAKIESDGRIIPDPLTAPKWFFTENCENCIEAFENWTGLDGLDGAWKDPIDVCRYLRIHDPAYLGGEMLTPHGGGSY